MFHELENIFDLKFIIPYEYRNHLLNIYNKVLHKYELSLGRQLVKKKLFFSHLLKLELSHCRFKSFKKQVKH